MAAQRARHVTPQRERLVQQCCLGLVLAGLGIGSGDELPEGGEIELLGIGLDQIAAGDGLWTRLPSSPSAERRRVT